MNLEDEILLERYFNISENSREYFDILLNVILNSKEFTDSNIHISNKKLQTDLLSLTINFISMNNFSFNAIYYVRDGEKFENRNMSGHIEISKNRFFIMSTITCFGEEFKEEEYYEIFERVGKKYHRFTHYGVNSYDRVNINIDEFNQIEEFKQKKLELIKSNKGRNI